MYFSDNMEVLQECNNLLGVNLPCFLIHLADFLKEFQANLSRLSNFFCCIWISWICPKRFCYQSGDRMEYQVWITDNYIFLNLQHHQNKKPCQNANRSNVVRHELWTRLQHHNTLLIQLLLLVNTDHSFRMYA